MNERQKTLSGIWLLVPSLVVVVVLIGIGLLISRQAQTRQPQSARIMQPVSTPTTFARTVNAASDSYGAPTWYFAHGFSQPDAYHTWFLLSNPGFNDAQVQITLHPDEGQDKTKNVQLPVGQRYAFYANTEVSGHFSATISSSSPIVAEESAFFANDGYSVPGVASPSTAWYFPEGFNGDPYDTYYHVFNPTGTSATVAIRFYAEGGTQEEITREVAAGTALRLRATELSSLQGAVAVRINSSSPVVAQRVTYFPGHNGGRGGHASSGIALLSSVWQFPLALADPNFDTWVMILNPTEADIPIEVLYVSSGEDKAQTYVAPAHSRSTIWVDREVSEGRAPEGVSAMILTGAATFAAESVIYDAPYQAGTASPGAIQAARVWQFAEGSTADPYTMYVALYNPGPTGAMVRPIFLADDTTQLPTNPGWALVPGETKIVNINDALAQDAGLALTLESDAPIVAQRLMTMSGSGILAAMGLPGQAPQNYPVAYFPVVIPGPPPLPTPTASPPAVEATPTRVKKSDGGAYILAEPITGTNNCGTTGIKGRITDANGAPVAGVSVRVWAEGWAGGLSNPSDADGRWDFVLGTGARAGTWFAAIAGDGDSLLSPAVSLPTSDNCQNGHQWLEINWQQREATAPAYELAWSRRLSCEENHGNHLIFIDVTDTDGNGIAGVTLRVSWPGGQADLQTGNKLEVGPGRAEFPMYKGTYSVQVLDGSSDTASNITVDLPDETSCDNHGNTLYHYSYHVVFRRK